MAELSSFYGESHSLSLPPPLSSASNIVLMSDKAVLVDFGLTVQMTEKVYTPRDLRGTEVSDSAVFFSSTHSGL